LALQKNDVQTMNITYVKNGKTLFGTATETPVIDEEGDSFLFGRLYDKTIETELKTRVTYLESGIKEILTNISVAASLFDKNRRLRFYNQAFMNLWGFKPDYLDTAPDHLDILDKLRANRLIPESRDYKLWRNEVFAPYHDIKAHYEDIWHTPQEKTIKCSISAYSDGGIVCLQEDVTDHIALEQSHNILLNNSQNTLNALDEGVILCDSYGKIKVVNDKIGDIFQTPIVLNAHLASLLDTPHHNNNLATFIQQIYHFIQNGFPDNEKYIQECLVNDSIFLASVSRLSTSDILIHIRDQTASLNYQKMLHYKTEMLKENEHIRESFFRRISHNLRDPMTAVAGFAELLQTEIFGTLNEKQREYITDMRYSIDDLLRLTDNLADLVRLDTHTLSDFQTISLRTILMNAIEAMQNEAFSRKITINRTINDDCFIKGDMTLLKQSFVQILENAIMTTPRGGVVTVNLIIEKSCATIQIIDQGSGMPAPVIVAIESQNINDITGYGLRYVLRVAMLHHALCHVKIQTDTYEKISGTCFEMQFALG
jgi:signal transduction histidine kinase